MDIYVLEATKLVGIYANSIDEALYKYHEGYSDGESEEEVISIYKDNEFLSDMEEELWFWVNFERRNEIF